MKKYQEPNIRYIKITERDILSISGQNLSDDLIIFDDVASEL